MKHIILVGMPGCGKTSVAKKLSTIIGCNYIDLDKFIEKYMGQTITDIFNQMGEEFFRQKEKECLQNIIENHQERIIISTGGGTFINLQNQELCLNKGIVFWINMNINFIAQRIKNTKSRPMFQNTNILLKLKELFVIREALYKQAHYKININDFKSAREVALIINNILIKDSK